MKNVYCRIILSSILIATSINFCAASTHANTRAMYVSTAEDREVTCPLTTEFTSKQLAQIGYFHKKEAKEPREFWKWFAKNEFELRNAKSNENDVVIELRKQLRAYNPNLVAHLGWTTKSLVIEPGGLANTGKYGEIEPYQSRERSSFNTTRRELLQISPSTCNKEDCLSAQTLVLAAHLPGECWQQGSLQCVQLGSTWLIELGPHPHDSADLSTIGFDSNDVEETRAKVTRTGNRIDLALFFPETSPIIRGLSEKRTKPGIGPPFPELTAGFIRSSLRYLLGEFYYQDVLGTISVAVLEKDNSATLDLQSTYKEFDELAKKEALAPPLEKRSRKRLDVWCSQFSLIDPTGELTLTHVR